MPAMKGPQLSDTTLSAADVAHIQLVRLSRVAQILDISRPRVYELLAREELRLRSVSLDVIGFVPLF
jgi:hypothetical protein